MKDARRTTLGDAFELIRFARFHIETAFKEWSEEPGNAGCAMPWSFRIGTAKFLELGDGDEITLDVDFGDSGGESPEDVEKKLRPLLIALGVHSVYTRRLRDSPCDVADDGPVDTLFGPGRYQVSIDPGHTSIASPGCRCKDGAASRRHGWPICSRFIVRPRAKYCTCGHLRECHAKEATP